MEGETAALVNLLVGNLIDVSNKEISVIRGLKKKSQTLSASLATVQEFLNDAGTRTISNGSVKSWVKKVEEVVFEADNVLDELKYQHLSHKIKITTATKHKVLTRCFSFLNNYPRQLGLVLGISKIIRHLKGINREAVGLGLTLKPTAPNTLFHASHPTDSYPTDPIFVGREYEVREIADALTRNVETELVSVVAIVGMGGIGKTTLARKVLNDGQVEDHFGQSRIWLTVPENFEPALLLKRILEKLTSSVVGIESMQVILEKLYLALKNKIYLLVLDDVWNENYLKWEEFMSFISQVSSTNGNAIIITSRNIMVAHVAESNCIYRLSGLCDEDCWSIIRSKAFPEGNCPPEFESIGRQITRKCCGLPLAASVIGGGLYKASMQEWVSIQEIGFFEDEPFIERILEFSYNLSIPSLKKCFAYCSIFPRGQPILKRTLIEMWMAEGFLQTDQSNDMESMGNQFIHVLVQNSLLLVSERDGNGNVKSCEMHDLLHDLASSVLDSSDRINQVRYSIPEDGELSHIPGGTEKYLRTLLFRGEITDHTMFSSFKSLHVLILECHQVTELPASIRYMRRLRNLDISSTRIGYLPDYIGELHYLQTLNALTKSLRELPSTFKYLISLRHLYIHTHVKLPPEIGALTNMQELKFRVGEHKGYRIEELRSLNNLKELKIDNLEKVHDKKEAEEAKLFEKKKLIDLQLEWNMSREGEVDDQSVMTGLQPCPNLEKLKIKGFRGKTFPSWTLKMEVQDELSGPRGLLNNLTEITLSKCEDCDEIPMLGHLPHLKSIHLWSLCSLKFIGSSFYGIEDNSNSGQVIFPALERMLLSDMPELISWEGGEFEAKVFPCLQSLKIYHCKNLGSLPSSLFLNAHNLTELDIRHCANLRNLPDGLNALNSLESITIKGCRNLKSIACPSGGGGGSLASLCSLEIRDCQELVEMVKIQAPLLKKVFMAELKSLKNLPRFIDSLAESPLVEELTIVGIPEFKSSSSVKIWPFCRLQKLEIGFGREQLSETLGTVNGILHSCNLSLGELILRGIEIWKWQPPSIQNLSALTNLELEYFGGEELPEWFADLSSLTRLCLSNCTELMRLPSKDVMKCLNKLEEFYIRDCPQLRIESERHKISHVRNIYVNGHPI